MPGGSKEGGGLEVKKAYNTGFKMKYQGTAFPFKSPTKHRTDTQHGHADDLIASQKPNEASMDEYGISSNKAKGVIDPDSMIARGKGGVTPYMKKGDLPTYQQAWDKMDADKQAKHGTFEKFKTAAKEWNLKQKKKKTKIKHYTGKPTKLTETIEKAFKPGPGPGGRKIQKGWINPLFRGKKYKGPKDKYAS